MIKNEDTTEQRATAANFFDARALSQERISPEKRAEIVKLQTKTNTMY